MSMVSIIKVGTLGSDVVIIHHAWAWVSISGGSAASGRL